MKDFFVSYNRADRAWAEWLAWQLEAAGYSIVIQAWDFRQGGNYVLDMQRAIESAQRTLIVLSPDFLASQYTAPEWAAAFAQDPTGVQGRLLPVRVRDCQPTGLLAQIVYIDLVGIKNRDEARERLLTGAASARAKPDHEPDMPTPAPGRPGVGPEPAWPPSLTLAARIAASVFWRIARFALVLFGVALAVLAVLAEALPAWRSESPARLYLAALLWGLGVALASEWVLRRRVRTATPQGSRT